MYINSTYAASVYAQLANGSSNTTSKSLLDYMTDKDDDKSSPFSDTVQLSKEAYAAIREYDPTLLASLGYSSEDSSESLIESTGSSALLDKVEISAEAYAALKETNPEVLEALGYDLSMDTE